MAVEVRERRRAVAGGVGLPRPGRRPGTVAITIGGPHLHLVEGVRGQARDRRAGAGLVLRAVDPAPAGALPVLQVVVVDGGTGVRRRRPGHRQAGGAAGDRGYRGGRRPARRLGGNGVGHGGRGQGGVGVAGGVLDGEGGELHGEVRGRGGQGRRQGDFDLGSSPVRRGRRQGDAVGLDGDVGSKDQAEEGLAERQDHLRAVGRRRRRIGAGGEERRADAVDLVRGVDGDRGVVEVGADGRAAGGVDGAAGELVRRDPDAVRGRVARQHRVAAHHRGRVRGVGAAGRFRVAVKVKLQLRAAGDVDRRVEGHRRRDRVADRDRAGGGGQGDRRDFRAVDRQRQADGVAVGPGRDVAEKGISVITGDVTTGVRQSELLGADVQNEIVGVRAECRSPQREIEDTKGI